MKQVIILQIPSASHEKFTACVQVIKGYNLLTSDVLSMSRKRNEQNHNLPEGLTFTTMFHVKHEKSENGNPEPLRKR